MYNISNPNLNNSILLKNVNLNNSILLKGVSYCYCYCSTTNGIFRSQSRALLQGIISMSTSREVDNETMVGVNSRFAEVTEDDILRMQDNAIPNNTKVFWLGSA